MIELEDVSYSLPDGSTLLSKINWRISPSESWVLFGRNGSGKSKLLQIISGYLYPSAGRVKRFGIEYGADIREVRKDIGYVGTFLKEMVGSRESVLDITASGFSANLGPYSVPGEDEREKALEFLKTFGMSEMAGRLFGTLSDGERQKCLILRATIRNPRLLILDEAATGLDISSREELLHLLDSLHEHTGVEIIYVTHHIEEITPLFKKIMILKDGKTFFSGEIDKGLTDEVLSDLFGSKIMVKKSGSRSYSVI